jgi:parallel beta-helix repeat protein
MWKRLLVACVALIAAPLRAEGTTYYVRQGAGGDGNDGRTPATAWRSLTRLGALVRAGDTVYVGPGLYRETVLLEHGGSRDARITFVADPTGVHTGDAPGTVMVAGADPVDEGIFAPAAAPGVYEASFGEYPVLGVVEMDGSQLPYVKATHATEHVKDGLAPLDVVARRPATFHYDGAALRLSIHTSDGKPPRTHEIELVRRANGIDVHEKHFVTVAGFTFRHMGNAGVNFFLGSGDGIAMHNTVYGCHQGIDVYGSTDTLVYRNTLFRNDNSGVYFAAKATGGRAIGNTAYENVKGLRWSSESNDGMALDNTLFENSERGLAIENAVRIVLRDNRLVDNAVSQLMAMKGGYDADRNCFARGAPAQMTADFVYGGESYRTLADYQGAKDQDRESREGRCGPLPAKVDVRRLHRETTARAAGR